MVQHRSRIGRNRPEQVRDGPRHPRNTPGPLSAHIFFVEKTPKINETSRRLKTIFLESPCFPKNVKTQLDFLTNRELELIYKARQMRNLEVLWYKIVFSLYLFYVSSRPRPISEKWVFKPFCYGRTLILKQDPKTTFQIQNVPKCRFS